MQRENDEYLHDHLDSGNNDDDASRRLHFDAPSDLRSCLLCNKLIHHSLLMDHLDECPENKLSCEYCHEGVATVHYDEHTFRCPRNVRCCVICQQRVQVAALGAHVATCSTNDSVVIMYHGTTLDNARHIMREGFRASTEGLLGPGVYLSRDLAKASNYGEAIVEVRAAIGRCVVINSKNARLKKNWHAHGYDSAWIPPQSNVSKSALEEHCIFDPSRVAPVRLMSRSV